MNLCLGLHNNFQDLFTENYFNKKLSRCCSYHIVKLSKKKRNNYDKTFILM